MLNLTRRPLFLRYAYFGTCFPFFEGGLQFHVSLCGGHKFSIRFLSTPSQTTCLTLLYIQAKQHAIKSTTTSYVSTDVYAK